MSDERKFSEHDLHAYVDGELDAETHLEVEKWIAANPDYRDEIEHWKKQRELLKAEFDPVLGEPISDQLVALLKRYMNKRTYPLWGTIAASLLLFVSGVIVGWGGYHLRSTYSTQHAIWPDLAVQAISAHVVFTQDKGRPVEIRAESQGQNLRWISKRFGRKLPTPDLSKLGWSLIGGRVLPLEDRAAAQFMYQNEAGKRLTIYIGLGEQGQSADYHFWRKGDVGCYYWFEGSVGFAVTAEIDKSELKKISELVYDHFEYL